MIKIEDKEFSFKTQSIWFSEPFSNSKGFDRVYFNAVREPMELRGFERIDYATIIIDLNEGLDSVWNKMDSKCRKAIRKSEKDGVDVCINRDYEQFLEQYSSFASSKGIKPLVKSIECLKKNGVLFCAEKEGEMIGGLFFLADETHMRGYVSCTRRIKTEDDMSLSANRYNVPRIIEANRLLWWEAIKYAADRGLEDLDMGGYYVGSRPNEDLEDVNEFKRRFGGRIINDYTYIKDYSLMIKMAKVGLRGFTTMRNLMGRPLTKR